MNSESLETQGQFKLTNPYLTERQQLYLVVHHRCALCDAELKIEHNFEKVPGRVIETAECPQCRIRTRSVEHSKN